MLIVSVGNIHEDGISFTMVEKKSAIVIDGIEIEGYSVFRHLLHDDGVGITTSLIKVFETREEAQDFFRVTQDQIGFGMFRPN